MILNKITTDKLASEQFHEAAPASTIATLMQNGHSGWQIIMNNTPEDKWILRHVIADNIDDSDKVFLETEQGISFYDGIAFPFEAMLPFYDSSSNAGEQETATDDPGKTLTISVFPDSEKSTFLDWCINEIYKIDDASKESSDSHDVDSEKDGLGFPDASKPDLSSEQSPESETVVIASAAKEPLNQLREILQEEELLRDEN